jgi:ABC-type uncharacterized transport system ATPase subunit
MSNFVIEAKGLRKSFEGRPAVDGLDRKRRREASLAFLEDGAARPPRFLLLIPKAGGGAARLFGETITGPEETVPMEQRIGYVSENKHLYPYMTVRPNHPFPRPFSRMARRSRTALWKSSICRPIARAIGPLEACAWFDAAQQFHIARSF